MRATERRSGNSRWGFYLLALALLALPGCGGCGDSKTVTQEELDEKLDAAKKKKKEEEKEPFEWGRVYSLPNDMERFDTNFKPGHWTEFTAEVWANQVDFSGDLVTEPFKITAPWVTGRGSSPVVVPYRLGTSRPALLPKQQKKHLGLVLFVPPGEGGGQLHFRLTPRGSSRSIKEQLQPVRRLKSWCFNFLVLAANSADYQQLLGSRIAARGLDSFKPGGSDEGGQHPYYHLRIPKLDRFVPVSENSLAWTSTAYVIWDGVDPGLLSEDQQQAMVDWLHWGGQLIISGPDSLDLLKDSFLSPYLPGIAEADIPLGPDDLKTFAETWTARRWTPTPKERDRAKTQSAKSKTELGKPRALSIVQPWSGKKLAPVPNAGVEVLAKSDRPDGAPLVLDRRVGLGRVALTAFRLGQKELRLSAWPSFDAFLNGCLMRRPPREFVARQFSGIAALWRQPGRTLIPRDDGDFQGRNPDSTIDGLIRDGKKAELASRVRYFTRDANLSDSALRALAEAENLPEERKLDSANPGDPKGFVIDDREQLDANQWLDPRSGGEDDELARPQSYSFGSGVAGWSDFNHPGQLVRNALADAAGIVIPRANKVVVMLAIYLAILVPLNFLVFRLIGRVEWAWIAAPIITIACSVAVIHYAGLNVGFARSRTEIAVVEIQGEHARAHVTRYTGVYTSLATSYDVEFDNPSSVIQPFAAHSRKELEDPKLFMRDSSTVQLRRDDKQITLRGFDVNSNSTGMLHTEHMLDLGGGIAARQVTTGTYELVNRTKLNLKGVAVLNRTSAGWVGGLDAGATKTVDLAARLPSDVAEAVVGTVSGDWFTQREQDSITARARRDEVLKARLLVRLAENPETLADGELRLVAWTPDELGGMEISPRASQSRFANVVVAHLRYDGPLKHADWMLGYDNHDRSSREAELSKQGGLPQFDDLNLPRHDLDGDGQSDVPLDPDDVPAAALRFVRRHDRTRDGTVDTAEWPPDGLVPIEEVDTDGNGRVTVAELEAFMRKQLEMPPE